MPEIIHLNTKVLYKHIPLINIILEEVFILIKISSIPVWDNGKRTDKIAGYSYECVDTLNYDHYNIKVENQTEPLMSNEELQERRNSGEKIFVEFTNATLTPYISSDGRSINDSVKADGVHIVETKN